MYLLEATTDLHFLLQTLRTILAYFATRLQLLTWARNIIFDNFNLPLVFQTPPSGGENQENLVAAIDNSSFRQPIDLPSRDDNILELYTSKGCSTYVTTQFSPISLSDNVIAYADFTFLPFSLSIMALLFSIVIVVLAQLQPSLSAVQTVFFSPMILMSAPNALLIPFTEFYHFTHPLVCK